MSIKTDVALFVIALSENVEKKINDDALFSSLTSNQKASIGETVWAELQVLQNGVFNSLDNEDVKK